MIEENGSKWERKRYWKRERLRKEKRDLREENGSKWERKKERLKEREIERKRDWKKERKKERKNITGMDKEWWEETAADIEIDRLTLWCKKRCNCERE